MTKLETIGSYDWYIPGEAPHAAVRALAPDVSSPKTMGELMRQSQDGKSDDLFDVTLYGSPAECGGDEEEQGWYRESVEGLEQLLADANIGARLRAELASFNAPTDENELEDWLANLDSEPYGRYQALANLLG